MSVREIEDPVPLLLPADRHRSAAGTHIPAAHRFTITGELADELRKLGARHHTSLFTILVAACQVLFARYSGQQDVAVGVATGGDHPGKLILRSRVAGTQPFGAFLATVGETVLAARAEGGAPAGTRVLVVQGEAPADPVDLAVVLSERTGPIEVAGPIEVTIAYDAGLFLAGTVERMAATLTTTLAAVAADPSVPLSELPPLTEAERRRVLVEWNDTARDYPADRCVHELVAEWARSCPDERAVISDDLTLTYAELDGMAARLAGRLTAAGVTAESRVGILQSRAPHAVVSMLAVLKAGGVYVPLHDSYPVDRIRWVLHDTGATVLLTDRAMGAKAREAGFPVIVVDGPEHDDAP
ncbi:AMP-binding protein, partial [Microbispora siamensis]|uniref:AMP-binding protein n=1 Tax=Microbispora siamensis TaxID=564413 RepID=UPI001950E4B6